MGHASHGGMEDVLDLFGTVVFMMMMNTVIRKVYGDAVREVLTLMIFNTTVTQTSVLNEDKSQIINYQI